MSRSRGSGVPASSGGSTGRGEGCWGLGSEGDIRVVRGGLGLARVWRQGTGPVGRGPAQSTGLHAPPRPYPPPRSLRSTRCRCPPPAAAPAAASYCARGRPWPAPAGSGLSPAAPWHTAVHGQLARPQVEREAASAPAAKSSPPAPPPGVKPRPLRTFRPAPGSSSLPLLRGSRVRPSLSPHPSRRDPALGLESLTLAADQILAYHRLAL